MYRTLKLEIKNAVATVTLNRPEARNAMSAVHSEGASHSNSECQ